MGLFFIYSAEITENNMIYSIIERMIKMAKYIDTNELYNKLRGRISVRQLEIIKELINECDTITVESEDE